MGKIFRILLFLLSVGFINISFYYSQCTNATHEQFPGTTFTPTTTAQWQNIATNAWAGEYSVVNVEEGNRYDFQSDAGSDFVTITSSDASVVYSYGTGTVSYEADFTGTIRFYSHTNSGCGELDVNRTRRLIKYAPCFDDPHSKYPLADYSLTDCNGAFETITTEAWAGEYSIVDVVSGNKYSFRCDGEDDYVTISNEAGNVAYAFGYGVVEWVATFSGKVRYYSHIANCGQEIASRVKEVACEATCTAPATQASSFNSSNVTSNSMDVSWTRGSGDGVIVVARAGGAVNANPANDSSYDADAVFGEGDEIGTDNYVVYKGASTTVSLTGLDDDETYHYAIYEYAIDGGDNCYNLTPLTGSATTDVCFPSTQATSFGTSNITNNSMDVSWTRGNGDRVVVVARVGDAVNDDPSKGSTYTANASFGSGQEIGTGNFVIYDGTGTSISVSGLNDDETYHYAVYEYNTTGNCYNMTPLTGSATSLACDGVPSPGATNATPGSICSGQTVDLSIENPLTGEGVSHQWQSSSDGSTWSDISGATSVTLTTDPITSSTYFRCNVTCAGSGTGASTPVFVELHDDELTDITGDEICPLNTAELSVNGNGGDVLWYDVASGGCPLGEGEVFTTPVISETTSFWASMLTPPCGDDEELATGLADGSCSGCYGLAGQMFNVEALSTQAVEINAIKVRPYDNHSSRSIKVYFKKEPLPSVSPTVGDVSPEGWILVHDGTNSGASNVLSNWIELDDEIVVPAGCVYSIYIDYRIRYRGTSSAADDRDDDYLKIHGLGFGAGTAATSFRMNAANYRAFRGELRYKLRDHGTRYEAIAEVKVDDDFIWNGSESTQWSTPQNWSCNTVPDATSDVTIPSSGVTHWPTIDNSTGNALCKDLTIESGATLTYSATVSPNIFVTFGNITIDGVLNHTGINFLQANGGSVGSPNTFGGSGAASGLLMVVGFNEESHFRLDNNFELTAFHLVDEEDPSSFDMNNYNLTTGFFLVNGSTLNFEQKSGVLDITLEETPVINSTAFDAGTGTTKFTRSGAQNIPALTYYNLETAGSENKNLTGDITVEKDLTIGGDTDLNAGTNRITLYGDWTNNGTFTPGSGDVDFVGAISSDINRLEIPAGTIEDDVFVLETFDAGIPSGWTQGQTGSFSTYDVEWKHSGSQCTGGGDGAPASPGGGFSGGYLIVNADCDGVDGMSNDGVTTLTSATYDLSDYTSLELSFDQYYRHASINSSQAKLEIKDGDGVWHTLQTWTATVSVENSTFDISSYADNSSDVQIRFIFSGGWIWYWLIDNFMITGDKYVPSQDYETFHNLTINKTSGATVDLLSIASVANEMTFTEGIVNATDDHYPRFETGATETGAKATSHVNGSAQKLTNSTTAFKFPVGDGTAYRPIQIEPASGDATTWTAKYNNTGYPILGVKPPLQTVSEVEYWDLDRTGDADGTVTLWWDEYSTVNTSDLSDLRVAHFDSGDDLWEDAGNSGTTGDATAGSVSSTVGWDKYSPFTIGSPEGSALPVTLTHFSINCKDESFTTLTWQTASEQNADFFAIEKSTDGLVWEVVGEVQAQGNSSVTHDYRWTDESPYRAGVSYYRLRQVDFDGVYEIFGPVSSNCIDEKHNDIIAYPNPTSGNITISYSWLEGETDAVFKLTDATGRLIDVDHVTLSNGVNYYNFDLSSHAKGVYFINVEVNNNQKAFLRVIRQ